MPHATARQQLAILGSTGSIGVSTLDVVARHPQRFEVVALSAHTRIDLLLDQCQRFHPEFVVVTDPIAAKNMQSKLNSSGLKIKLLSGPQGLEEVASLPQVQTVMAAIVGIAGLKSTLAAAVSGKKILLANKESLVSAGALFIEAVHQGGATLLPIDSEHNAIFQSLPNPFNGQLQTSGVRRILLTASGGPFRLTPLHELHSVTPLQACAHPNWVMGRKISVDSATMMNKALEVIEAHWLFNAPASAIEVLVHPQSIVHSLVEYIDGSMIAQLGNPDMRTPIAHGLAYPERIENGVNFLDLTKSQALQFEKPDWQRFPCLALGFEALRLGGGASTVINAANEIAVERFLNGALAFMDIPRLIESVLTSHAIPSPESLEAVIELDHITRQRALLWKPHVSFAAIGL